MYTYACLFCGVKHRTPRPITTCAICGQTADAGWLHEESCEQRAERPPAEITGRHEPARLRSAA